MILLDALKDINNIEHYLRNNSFESIIFEMTTIFNVNIHNLLRTPMGGYTKSKTSGNYFYCIKDLKENLDEYIELYNMLEDDKSKNTFLNLIRYRITTDIKFIKDAFDEEYEQYFDKEIIKCNEDEVFVDCGAFIGDTIEKYINNYEKYKSIYGYEPEIENFIKCRRNTEKFKNIKLLNSGVSDKTDTVYYKVDGGASYISENETETLINTVTIDESINEKLTFIKMDVEGEEINAIMGCKNHIKNDSPKLAIAIYHIVSDIWEIPKLIKQINGSYKLYMRHYREDVAWETVLYAIPS